MTAITMTTATMPDDMTPPGLRLLVRLALPVRADLKREFNRAGLYQRYQLRRGARLNQLRRRGLPTVSPTRRKNPSTQIISAASASHHRTCMANPIPKRIRTTSRATRMTAIGLPFVTYDMKVALNKRRSLHKTAI